MHMRYFLTAIALACLLVQTGMAASAQQSLSFYGTLYRSGPSSPVPVSGAQVFLFAGEKYIGPSITDENGRYAFFNVPTGRYALIIYNSTKQVLWQEPVFVEPGAPAHNVVLRS